MIAVGTSDINIDACCSRTTYPDTALVSIPGRDDTMVSGGSTAHSDLYGPGYSMVLGHQHGPRLLGNHVTFGFNGNYGHLLRP